MSGRQEPNVIFLRVPFMIGCLGKCSLCFCGAPKYLSNSKEEELVSFLVGCAQIGFGKTRSGVILLVEKLLSSCGVEKEMPSG